MKAQVKREQIQSLPLGFRFPEFARAAISPADEDCETPWDRIIRMCDGYGLKPREHCPA
jgi:hypothetical protein